MDTKILISLLNKLLSADVFLASSPEDLGSLQGKINPNNLFEEFTADYLSGFTGSMNEKTFYELINTMGERLLMFRCEDGCIIIGPYLKRVIDENEITRRMIANRIPGYYLNILKTQYSSCAVLDTQNICDIASSCISALSSDAIVSYDFVKTNNFETPSLVSAHRDDGDEVYENIYRKYEVENDLIFKIEHGLVDDLKASIKRMKALNRSVIEMEYFSTHPKEAMASLRAMARMAAVRSGLSVVVIDGIMSKYTHLMRDAVSLQESERLVESFQLEMASAVREHLTHIPDCSPFVKKVAEYIVLHYNSELTLPEIARRFSINPSHLSRTFKNEMGKGFKEFLEEIRIANAVRYLETTDMPVGQISNTVGYYDNNYFTKVFKKITGKTPRDYRASVPGNR